MEPLISGPGFELTPLLPPEQLNEYFEIGDPLNPADRVDYLGEFYGVDLRFGEDFLTQADGDLQLTTGLEAFRANLARALVTRKGDIFWRPDYGIGLQEFLNARPTAEARAEMENRIRSTLGSNPDVEEVVEASVTQSASGDLIEVNIRAFVLGEDVLVAFGISAA